MTDAIADLIRDNLRDVPDFPEPGVVFKDITPLLADPGAFRAVIDEFARRAGDVDLVAGVEARGFVFGTALAMSLNRGFVPIRKSGKLPGDVIATSYDLEYGSATIEVHADAFTRGQRVLVVDDVLATGGTATAACRLVELAGGVVTAFTVLVELSFLPGRERLAGRHVEALLTV